MTETQYKWIIQYCKSIFEKKNADYGTAWRILRLSSVTDQIFIKAQRIRSIQEAGKQEIEDDMTTEFIGMINYCLIAMMQISLKDDERLEIPLTEISPLYDHYANLTLDLLLKKNHDYQEAWRQMRVSSMTDLILMKLRRIKQIEDNKGITLISEGVEANYQDILNYSVFCLIQSGFIYDHQNK